MVIRILLFGVPVISWQYEACDKSNVASFETQLAELTVKRDGIVISSKEVSGIEFVNTILNI